MKKWGVLFFGVLLVSLVSAGFLNYNPLDYFDNEWVVFGIVFFVSFTLIYMGLGSFFSRNERVSPWGGTQRVIRNKMGVVIMSLALALLISVSVIKRGWLEGYLGESLLSWVLFVVVLFFGLMIFKIAYQRLGKLGLIFAMFVIWVGLNIFDPYDIFPSSFSSGFLDFYEVIAGGFGIIIIGILALIFLLRRSRRGLPVSSLN